MPGPVWVLYRSLKEGDVMYGHDAGMLTLGTSAGSGAFASTLATVGNRLWVPFAVVALSFAAISLKELLTRPKSHRP